MCSVKGFIFANIFAKSHNSAPPFMQIRNNKKKELQHECLYIIILYLHNEFQLTWA